MPEIRYHCDKCGRTEKRPDNFYRSHSSLYDNNGYMPICKDCLSTLFDRYIHSFHDTKKAIKRICMAFDLYYNDKIADPFIKKASATLNVGDYIKILNMIQYKGKTFDNTIDEGFSFYDETDGDFVNTNNVAPLTTIPKTVRAKWGSGFTDNDYILLEDHYKSIKNANPNCDSNQEIFIIDLCFIKMQQMNALRNRQNEDYIKLADAYRKTFQQAGLKTIRDSSESENFTMGVTAETIEKYTPAEFYKDRSLFKDSDNIGDYVERFMLRPLKNLMFGSKDRDKEFYVKDESEDNGFDDEE